jgi:hypothetical protein
VKKQITQVGLYALVFGGAFGFLYCSLWYGFYLVTIEGSLTLGGLTAFQSYVFIIGAAIGSTVSNLAQLVFCSRCIRSSLLSFGTPTKNQKPRQQQ